MQFILQSVCLMQNTFFYEALIHVRSILIKHIIVFIPMYNINDFNTLCLYRESLYVCCYYMYNVKHVYYICTCL